MGNAGIGHITAITGIGNNNSKRVPETTKTPKIPIKIYSSALKKNTLSSKAKEGF